MKQSIILLLIVLILALLGCAKSVPSVSEELQSTDASSMSVASYPKGILTSSDVETASDFPTPEENPPASTDPQQYRASSIERVSSESVNSSEVIPQSDSELSRQSISKSNNTGTTQSSLPIHTHRYTAKVIAATCTQPGYTEHHCSCGNAYRDQEITALGHSFGEWHTTVAPTETAPGKQIRICTRCGIQECSVIPKLTVPAATQADTQWMAARVAELLSEERQTVGVGCVQFLPGLSKVCEYRATALVTNFSHEGCRQAFTAMQYGVFHDLSATPGCTDADSYYGTSGANSESICWASFSGLGKEEEAQQLMRILRGSPGHWTNLSDIKYCYAGVGITLSGGKWYCSVIVTENNDE